MELGRVGATSVGDASRRLLSLDSPPLDFVALATGMGVPATRAVTAEEFAAQLPHERGAGIPDVPRLAYLGGPHLS